MKIPCLSFLSKSLRKCFSLNLLKLLLLSSFGWAFLKEDLRIVNSSLWQPLMPVAKFWVFLKLLKFSRLKNYLDKANDLKLKFFLCINVKMTSEKYVIISTGYFVQRIGNLTEEVVSITFGWNIYEKDAPYFVWDLIFHAYYSSFFSFNLGKAFYYNTFSGKFNFTTTF